MSTNPEVNALVPVNIGDLIIRSPDFRHNEPHIAGTGVSVKRIAVWYKLGATPEEIATNYSHLTLAQVYAALAYYHANTVDIEALIAEDEGLYEEAVTQQHPQEAA